MLNEINTPNIYYRSVNIILMNLSKAFLLCCILVLAMTQVIPMQTPAESPKPYVDVPIDNLDELNQFMLDSIYEHFVGVDEYQLTSISYMEDQTSGNTTYLFEFTMIDENGEATNISKTITVITADQTIFYIFQDQELIATVDRSQPQPTATTTPPPAATDPPATTNPPAVNANPPTQEPPLTGGFSQSNINQLSSTEQSALDFVIVNVDLTGWTLVSVRTQVVAGENICFTYKKDGTEQTQEYCVWSQVWRNNFMELTLPDGSKITTGGQNRNLQSN